VEQSGAAISVSIQAETLFTIGPLEITNSMVGAVLASAILLVAAWWFVRRAALVPSSTQSLIEFPIEWMTTIVRESGGSRWRAFVSLVATLFLLILVANWLSIFPGVGTIGFTETTADGAEQFIPFIRPASADLNFTLGLTLVSFVTFVYWGVRVNGVRGYLRELRGEPAWMAPLMMPIHIISDLSRLISLSMRLFGNVFAGDILLATMLVLAPIVVPAAFMGLELIFGFIQALVFALLTMTYIILAIAEHAHSAEGHVGEGQPVEAG
jgi:F-type H+-transporting ATPase subunit a